MQKSMKYKTEKQQRNQSKSWFFERINKSAKPWPINQDRKSEYTNYQHQKWTKGIITEPVYIKGIRELYEQYAINWKTEKCTNSWKTKL